MRCLPFLFVLSSVALAQEPAGDVRAWEHETSDIPVDPRIRFGHLDNGLRFAWTKNAEPENRCYVRLHVDAGSLAEEESQRGMAHFLEHMAFNGSENYPAGTLIEWFQEHGMDFGADTNAHTGFSETVYKLDLPNSDEETLRSGLLVLRDFAAGLLLEPEEVEAEKGVIDGEQRESDSAGFRAMVRTLDTLYEGTRFPERLPIGTQAARSAFTAESIRAFYQKWYRPENMTLVVVGDLGELDPEPLFREFFADLVPPEAPIAPEPEPGKAEPATRFFAIDEDEIPRLSITVEKLRPYEEEAATVANMVDDLPLDFARAMLNLRYAELAKKEGTPYLGAGLSGAGGLEVYEGESLSISCDPEKWQEALTEAAFEVRKALEFGFQEAELAEIRANALRSLDEAVDRERTRHSLSILAELLNAAEERSVPTNAETDRAILKPAIEALTVAACHEALVESWNDGFLSIYTLGDLDLGEAADETLRAAYAAALEREVEAGAEIATQAFAYSSDPEQRGEVVAKEHVEDLDLWLVEFANGVRLNVKQTDFKERQILLSARLAEGQLTLPDDEQAVGWVGGRVFDAGGLGEHTIEDIRRLCAGKDVGVGFGVGLDAFVMNGGTTSEDLLLEFELLCAMLQDPGWREDGLVQLRKQVPLMFESMEHQHQGPLVLEFLPALFDNQPRMVPMPSADAILGTGMDAVRAWLAPHLNDGPLEVAVVGDLEVDEVIALAARTLGALPARREALAYEDERVVEPPRTGLRMREQIETEVPKSLVLLAVPLTDGLETDRRRNLGFLGKVVNDRLRLEVRERLGASYSPGAGTQLSSVYPGVGLLMIQAMSDPEKVETLVDACLAVLASLSDEGIEQAEVDRLAEPAIAQLRDGRRTNGYWLGTISQAQSDPAKVEDARTIEAYYQDVSAEAISKLAAEYLHPDRASLLIVDPEPQEPAPDPIQPTSFEETDGDG